MKMVNEGRKIEIRNKREDEDRGVPILIFKLGKEFYESIIITYPFDEIGLKKV